MPDYSYPPDLQHLTSIYLALLISGGQVGLPIVVLTVSVGKKVAWHPTIINFCIAWTIYSIIYCLYLFAGAGTDSQYSTICMVQASMVQGAAPMAVVAGLAIVVHMWATFQCVQCTALSWRVPRMLYLILMLGTPYLVFVVFAASAASFVISQAHTVSSNGLYCFIQLGHPVAVVPSFCAAVMVIILALEAVMTFQYYRQWKTIRTSFPLATRTPSPSVCFRVGLFCLYSCVTFTAAILWLSDLQTDVTYMLPAALPLCALIVIGLQKDVISFWTVVLRGRKNSGSSLDLGVPSARATSRSDPTSPLEFSEESTIVEESSMPV